MVINIASEFSPFPAGRVPEDGDHNGQTFREEFLRPRLKQAERDNLQLVVSLDGLKSCGSSFLESAFGGLVRYDGFSKMFLDRTLKIEYSSPSLERYKLAIERYIARARPE